ncbi:extracellular solute-binding protein ['Camptotheca acuminata' phytoplasma]|uniref:extracellular solute-binding protein n=1 Tax='Camptotheca acuminata' phytoplasma TaxID=3239192 RepID=UPI003519E03E
MKKKNYLILLFCLFIFIFIISKKFFYTDKNNKNKKEILVLNWAEYIEPSIIQKFNEKPNNEFIVKQIFLPSNEIAINKIKSGNKYDVAILSEYAIEQLKEKHLEKIDKEKIKQSYLFTEDKKDFNYNDKFKKIKEKTNDNDVWDYNIPYLWGKLGLLYNKRKLNPDSKELVFDEVKKTIENYDNKVALYNNPFEVIFLGLIFNSGDISVNSKNSKEDIEKAKNWLIRFKSKHKNLSFITDQLLDRMKIKDEESYDIVLAYSGDARYLMKKNNNLDYYQFDDNGTNVWFDGLCLPKEGNKEGAYKFINFLLKKDNMKKNTEYIDFDSPYELDYKNSILPLSVNKNDKILSYNPNNQCKEQINEAWNQVYTYPDSKDKYLIIASLIILFFCFLIYLFLKYN